MTETLKKNLEFFRKKAIDLKQKLESTETKLSSTEIRLSSTETKLQQVMDEYHKLRQSFLEAQRKAFGKKSERFVDDSKDQLPLFETESDHKKSDSKDLEEITYTRKKKKIKKPDLSKLPQREEIINVAEAERKCNCGCDKEFIRYEIKRLLNYQPAIFEVITQKREMLACKKGCKQSIVTAEGPKHILAKCRASETLLSHIAISKVLDRQPLYHLEKKIEREHDWRIPRHTMARWMIQLSEKLQPLINLMKEELLGYDIAAMDATTLQVLNEPGRMAETKSYAFCIRGGPPGKEVTLYEYNGDYKAKEYTHKEFVSDTLSGFKGTLHCDAADTFDEIGNQEGVTLSYCHAHARRKFEAIEKVRTRDKKKKGKPGLAHYVLKEIYQPLYTIERQAKEKGFSADDIKAYRQEKSKPILDEWYKWLIEHKELTLKESPIGKAIRYALNQWKGLQVYLTDGRIEIDNNATEREIKPFVMARKNFLFACTQAGADSLGVHFSLILTAKAHGLNPVAYYTEILKRIPFCSSFEDYEQLLPWNFKRS